MISQERLYFGLPIVIDENCSIYQPKLKDMLYNDLSLEMLIEPLVTLDKQNFEKEKDNEEVKNFDMFFVEVLVGFLNYIEKEPKEIDILNWLNSEESNGLTIKRLINTLKFLFKTDDVQLYVSSNNLVGELKENFILINKSYKIDRDTYDYIKGVICEIFDTQIKFDKKVKSKEESELDKMFAKKKKMYEETYGDDAKKDKNKDNMTVFTLVNYIINSRFSQYDYNNIQELTIYQIKNTFKYYQSQETFDIDMKYRTSGNFKMDNKTEHWFFDK